MPETCSIRAFAPSDAEYAALAAIGASTPPQFALDYEFRDAADWREFDESFAQAGRALTRYMAACDGVPAGYAYAFEVDWAPPPQPRDATSRRVEPTEAPFTGFVFKIQANMDPRHRDRVAFVRLCSGRFERGMKLFHPRSGKTINIHTPVMFLAREREIAEEAFPGDIVGIPNHGALRIGDALTEGEKLRFLGIPSFAPELLQKVRAGDPLKAKHLGKALTHLAEEGAAQVFKAVVGGDWIVGVAGALQFDVLASRIKNEYDLPVRFEGTTLHTARWVDAEPEELKRFLRAHETYLAEDHNGAPVYLAPSAYRLKATMEDWPKVRFAETREHAQ